MGASIADQYYLKAFDNYPYDIEVVVENLSYALSYDENHAQSNYLMACVHMYVFKKFDTAVEYFDQALVSDLNYPDTYKNYSKLLIWLGEFEKANKLISFGLKVKGMDRKALLLSKASIYELRGNLEEAKKILKDVRIYCLDSSATDHIEKELSRLKNKTKKIKQKKVSAKKMYASTKKED